MSDTTAKPTGTHTPGPWTIDLDYDRDGHHGINSEARMWKAVAECSANTLGAAKVSQDEAEANARLIAASPELLAACLALVEFWNNGTPVHPGAEVVADVRQAIAKATGGQS